MIGFFISIIALTVCALFSVAFAGIWVFKDAKQRGLQAGAWTLLVVLSGNFIGLILYLLIGRKQIRVVCDKCGAASNSAGAFCPLCGERIAAAPPCDIKRHYGFIFASITCVVLVFVFLGMSLLFYFNADGFTFNKQYSYYRYGSGGYVKNMSQSSSVDTWDFSFYEASGGYTLSKTYNASSPPMAVSVDIQCSGSIQLIISQDGASINETLREGSYRYDLAAFKAGKIHMDLINVDAANLSGKIIVEAGEPLRLPENGDK